VLAWHDERMLASETAAAPLKNLWDIRAAPVKLRAVLAPNEPLSSSVKVLVGA